MSSVKQRYRVNNRRLSAIARTCTGLEGCLELNRMVKSTDRKQVPSFCHLSAIGSNGEGKTPALSYDRLLHTNSHRADPGCQSGYRLELRRAYASADRRTVNTADNGQAHGVSGSATREVARTYRTVTLENQRSLSCATEDAASRQKPHRRLSHLSAFSSGG